MKLEQLFNNIHGKENAPVYEFPFTKEAVLLLRDEYGSLDVQSLQTVLNDLYPGIPEVYLWSLNYSIRNLVYDRYVPVVLTELPIVKTEANYMVYRYSKLLGPYTEYVYRVGTRTYGLATILSKYAGQSLKFFNPKAGVYSIATQGTYELLLPAPELDCVLVASKAIGKKVNNPKDIVWDPNNKCMTLYDVPLRLIDSHAGLYKNDLRLVDPIK